jgi:hypothetical protein
MLKLLLATVASFALLSAAAAADLPRTEPLPVATVGKAPIGKLPAPAAAMSRAYRLDVLIDIRAIHFTVLMAPTAGPLI